MADWGDGYVTDVAYVAGYHSETSPVWMTTVVTVLGFAAPDLTRPFRYADLGCGNGVTALNVAATMPNAEVWGFDFNPAHVEAGRELARRAGLTNVRFEEASFDDLARLPPEALPAFDHIVAHGVLSWISLENRRRLFQVIGRWLAAGGLAYLSYNVPPGWTGMRPVRTLMRLLVEASPERTDAAAAGVFETLEKMKAAGAAMFAAHPSLDSRLSGMRGSDPRYVAHELLNRDWHPVMFDEVASDMAAIKCEHIGSATLPDNFENMTIPPAMRDMVRQARTPRVRETLRDLASASGFRRDLFQRGPRKMSAAEHEGRVNAVILTRTTKPVPAAPSVATALGSFTLQDAHHATLLKRLDAAPLTIGAIRALDFLADRPPAEVFSDLVLMLAGGYVAPMVPDAMVPDGPDDAARAACARLNRVYAEMFEAGRDLPLLACPAIGTALSANFLEILTADALLAGVAPEWEALADAVLIRLRRSGRTLNQNGREIADPVSLRGHVAEEIRGIMPRLPMMRRLGVLS